MISKLNKQIKTEDTHHTMATPNRNRSLTRRRGRKLKTWVLALVVIGFAALIIAGPRLFAQAPGQPGISTSTSPVHMESTPNSGSHGGEAIQLPFGPDAWLPLYIVLAGAFVALGFGAYW